MCLQCALPTWPPRNFNSKGLPCKTCRKRWVSTSRVMTSNTGHGPWAVWSSYLDLFGASIEGKKLRCQSCLPYLKYGQWISNGLLIGIFDDVENSAGMSRTYWSWAASCFGVFLCMCACVYLCVCMCMCVCVCVCVCVYMCVCLYSLSLALSISLQFALPTSSSSQS